MHAAGAGEIQHLRLDDVDLAGRHITLHSVRRNLDDLTREVLIAYLKERRERWPNTANPYLIVSSRTAYDQRPVSDYPLTQLFKNLTATIDQLRKDRLLEEALTHGPDPLHLSAVFGVCSSTAMRYAAAARVMLHSAAEQAVQADPRTPPSGRLSE